MVIRIFTIVLAVLAPLAASAEPAKTRFDEPTVAQLQAAMASGRLTSEALTRGYIKRILDLDQDGPGGRGGNLTTQRLWWSDGHPRAEYESFASSEVELARNVQRGGPSRQVRLRAC